MKQVLQYQKNGNLFVDELPMPRGKMGYVIVQNAFSVISAGTERSSVKTAQSSWLGKARSRPDLVRQVLDNVRREGLTTTYKKVMTRIDNFKELGYSSAGVVIESGVARFKMGDRVACAGVGYASHAEFISIPGNLVVKVPDNVGLDEAAMTTVASIALQGVRQAQVSVGETIGVVGLGLIGLMTVQLLRTAGCRVIGFDVAETNFSLAKDCGCIDCLRSDSSSLRRAENLSHGLGYDAVIITAATTTSDPIKLAMQIARKKGRVVVVGSVGMNIERSPFYEKELDLRMSCSYGPGRYDASYEEGGNDYPVSYVRWTENRNMEAILDLCARDGLDLKVLITHTFDIDDALNAYDLVTGKRKERHLGILLRYPGTPGTGSPGIYRVEVRDGSPATKGKGPTIGFIGAGNFAQSYLIPWLKKEGVTLRGVATSKPVNAKVNAKKFGFTYGATDPAEVMDDKEIDLVFVATRHDSHAKFALAGLEAGKAIFVEKPLAIDEEELQAIISKHDDRRKGDHKPFIMVGFNRRFSRPLLEMKHFFAGRTEPLSLTYRVNAGYIANDHWYQRVEQNGRIIGEACHYIDTFQYLTGALPVEVYASGISDPARRYNRDNVHLSIRFADGSVGTIVYLACGPLSLEKEYIEVVGEEKTAIMDNFKTVRYFHGRKSWRKRYSGTKGHHEEIAEVIRCFRQGTGSPISFSSLVTTTRATFAAVESFKSSMPVQLERL